MIVILPFFLQYYISWSAVIMFRGIKIVYLLFFGIQPLIYKYNLC